MANSEYANSNLTQDQYFKTLKISKFYGKTDPEEYLEWEKMVESVFNCHNFSDAKKVLLCIAQFKQYAQIW